MKIRSPAFSFTLLVLSFLPALLIASIALPHDRYIRYLSHDNVTTKKADWIYERLHADPTPIDVALIGSSRTGGGLSAPLIEQTYEKITGRHIHVANLSLPRTGRNLHYSIVKETAATKHPALFIVELNDREDRKPHPDFIKLADTFDILTAPLFVNIGFFRDVARLPGRQASLFAKSVQNTVFGEYRFDRDAYEGSHLDQTQTQVLISGETRSRDRIPSIQTLEAGFTERERRKRAIFITPQRFHRLEYRPPRYYLRKIEAVASAYAGELDYLYLPAYKHAAPPVALLDVLDLKPDYVDLGADLAHQPTLWLDRTHLNAQGAKRASERFAHALAANHPRLGRPSQRN